MLNLKIGNRQEITINGNSASPENSKRNQPFTIICHSPQVFTEISTRT